MVDGVARAGVSVIVPVWNVEPYLRECLDSVVGQTIGLDRIQLIAVDDGSTDAGGRILDDYAARVPGMTVVHQPNSGGPGGPRNVGLDRATGTYVFFLDADDYLGVEALERLVRMAERSTSDIVLGRIVSIGGRAVSRRTGAFRRDQGRVDPEAVYRSGRAVYLFRRSLIERAGLRFPEGVPSGEDGDFMARAYLEASTISVVAEYDCYFVRRRPGSQTRRTDRTDDIGEFISRVERERIVVLAARRKPGLRRDMLMVKHIAKIAAKYNHRWRSLDATDRRRVFDVGAGVIGRWHTRTIQRALHASSAIRVYCLQHGLLAELEDVVACPASSAFRDPVVDRGRVFARYPHFRDGSGIPDSCFDVTKEVALEQCLASADVADDTLRLSGQAYLVLVGGSTAVELRRWPRGVRLVFGTNPVPTRELRDSLVAYPLAGFEVAIDLATAMGGRPLGSGTWAIRLSTGMGRVHRTAPLRAPQGLAIGSGVAGRAGLVVNPARELRLRIGRPRQAEVWLARAEDAGLEAERLVALVVSRTRAGRMLDLAIGEFAKRAWRVR